MSVAIRRVARLPIDQLTDLADESEQAGVRFVRRLIDDWTTGVNRFDQAGEALYAAWSNDRLIGTCGINVDPYADDPRVARVRHLYVARDYRRQSVGRRLVQTVIAPAGQRFAALRLRTDSPEAATFYEHLGFKRCHTSASYTHLLAIQTQNTVQPCPWSTSTAKRISLIGGVASCGTSKTHATQCNSRQTVSSGRKSKRHFVLPSASSSIRLSTHFGKSS
jgi:GNAT superfamily N-acetyltransferase